MKIIVTNESGLTDEHLKTLRSIGEVTVFTDTTTENVYERLKGAEIAVVDCYITPITKEFLGQTKELKFFSINSTGFDNVDVQAVHNSGIVASNVPGFSTEAVAEMAIGLMFAVVRKIPEGDREFRATQIRVDPGTPAAAKYLGFELKDKTLGVIGLGAIGSRVVELGKGLGMRVIGYNRTPKQIQDVRMADIDDVMREADVVVVCLALTEETKGFISRARIASIKKSSIFVSIAGMAIIDQAALKDALNSGALAGAGLDTADSFMFDAKNTVLTPHMAFNTREASKNMGRIILGNITAYIKGKPVNPI